jgi:flagellar basal-body rod protein FlgG
MGQGIFSAAAGMNALETRLDAVANDLANVNTDGYKQVRLGFRDLVYAQRDQNVRVGSGAAAVDAGRDFSPGALETVDDPLALAIDGPGFFQVRRADGSVALTRSGDFRTDAAGNVVTASGEQLVPPIRIPAGVSTDKVGVAADGTVTAGSTTLGKITVVDVTAPSLLMKLGDNMYAPTAGSGSPTPVPGSTLQQGYLESSNVDLGQTMVAMIDAQRSFQLDSRAIQTQDQMMQVANQIRQ